MIRFTLLITIFLLSGCGIGGFWMNGDPSVGRNLKPYGAHWIKEGMTRESRLNDTKACGAGRSEYVLFSTDKIKAAMLSDDPNEVNAMGRLSKRWAECMESKGYAYLPECDARCLYP
ncbi:MAG: hypothetical protein K0U21_08205 [Proteobacteria bacterium]|nr:hypothetical protein [Pseudomonadota bacterium]